MTLSPTKSIFLNSAFSSVEGLTVDQGYSPGYLADYTSSGFNAIETGLTNQDSSVTDPNAFASGQGYYVASTEALVAGTSLFLGLAGDAVSRNGNDLWNWTQGTPSTFNPPAVQTMFQSWSGQPNKVMHIFMQDEVNSSWGAHPLQGPIMFHNSPTTQSGLTSIGASGGNCTVNWTNWGLNGAATFLIHGATASGFNNIPGGALFHASRIDNNTYIFGCPVPNGTYNASTDPNLVIEPYGAGWCSFPCNGTTGSGYIPHNVFAEIMRWAANVPAHPPITWPNAFNTNNTAFANWEGNSNQSIGSITQVSDHADVYNSSSGYMYLASRYTLHDMEQSYGDVVRLKYGFLDPSKTYCRPDPRCCNELRFQHGSSYISYQLYR
jgi:hypothetical protein